MQSTSHIIKTLTGYELRGLKKSNLQNAHVLQYRLERLATTRPKDWVENTVAWCLLEDEVNRL